MKKAFLVLLIVSSGQLLAAQTTVARKLHGRIVDMDKEPPTGVPAARIKILGREIENVADQRGEFSMALPNSLRAGDEVEIDVDAVVAGEKFSLFQPLNGRIRIPANPAESIVTIGLLPQGSLRFYSDDAIQALLQRAIGAEPRKPTHGSAIGLPSRQFDLTGFLEQWAKERGLDTMEVAKRVAAWADVVEGQTNATREQQALAAFAKRNFREAGRLFAEAGDIRLQKLRALRQQEKELQRQAVEDYTQGGDANFSGGFYRLARENYGKALAETSREDDPAHWAELKLREGDAYMEFGGHGEGPESGIAFNSAKNDYYQALQIFTKTEYPQDWARIQIDLGNVFRAQGERSAGKAGQDLLA